MRARAESHIILNLSARRSPCRQLSDGTGVRRQSTMNRFLRVILLLIWIELGFALILLPWSDIWEMNFFLFQYPALGFLIKNAFFRGAISGLGVMNVLLALQSFRHRPAGIVSEPGSASSGTTLAGH